MNLVWSEHGEGDPPLVLLHGFTGSRLDWADVVEPLAASRRVITYDHRGHGDSPHTGDYTFDALVTDLASFVDDLALGPFDLLGHSMGGVVAMRYATAHPERLRSLILMDTAAEPQGAIPAALVESVGVETGRTKGMEEVAVAAAALASGAGARPELVERTRIKLASMDVEAFAGFARELDTYPSVLADLASLQLPVTVIVGANDTNLRAGADTLATTIPGASLVVIGGAGHSPQEDAPGDWLAAVEAHLKRA